MKYVQITKYIQHEISNNHLKCGEKIPSIRKMATLFNCSKATVIRAYNELENCHILYSSPQSGYFVVHNKIPTPIEAAPINFSSMMPEPTMIPYLEFRHCMHKSLDIYREESLLSNDAQGLPDLRIALSKQLQNYQIFVKSEKIYITAGAQQTLDILVRMPFPNGKTVVLVEQPTYPGILKSLKFAGVTTIGITRNYGGINFNELEYIFKNQNIKFFYTMPCYQNPTGSCYTKEEKQIILKLAHKYDVYLVEDDYLAEFNFDTKSDPLYSMDDSEHVLYIKSYSKVCLPGLRIGAVLLPHSFHDMFLEYKSCVDPYVSSVLQGTLAIFIKNDMYTKHVKNIRKFYSNRMAILLKSCEQLPSEITWQYSDHCCFIFFELPDKIDFVQFSFNLQAKNLLISGGNQWYLPNYKGKCGIRLCIYQTDKKAIIKGMSLLIQEIKYWLNK